MNKMAKKINKHSLLDYIQVISTVVIALGIFALIFSLLKYNPEDRVSVLAEATQQFVASVTPAPVSVSEDGTLGRDYACVWLNTTVQGTYYKEYTVGYFLTGETIKKTGNTLGQWTEVLTEGTRLANYTTSCWIK